MSRNRLGRRQLLKLGLASGEHIAANAPTDCLSSFTRAPIVGSMGRADLHQTRGILAGTARVNITPTLPSRFDSGIVQFPHDRRGEASHGLRRMSFPDVGAYCADAHRSILDIRDEIAAEYAPVPIDSMKLYFRAFE